jgi:hypothetical protein
MIQNTEFQTIMATMHFANSGIEHRRKKPKREKGKKKKKKEKEKVKEDKRS